MSESEMEKSREHARAKMSTFLNSKPTELPVELTCRFIASTEITLLD